MPIPGLTATSAGDYRLEISSSDAKGNPVLASTEFSVSAADAVSWDYRNDVRLELQADRASYTVGQTARVLVEAPFSGEALVTLERERVLRSFWTKLEGNSPVIEIPLTSNDVPNVVVSVTLLRGAENCPRTIQQPDYRAGFVSLDVVDPSTRLSVEVNCHGTNYLPGALVRAEAQVRNAAGEGVSNAWLTVYAVDEGIASLTGQETPDPHSFFYAPKPLRVTSSISLPNLLTEDLDALSFHNKGFLGGDGADAATIRRKFLACAFWSANIRADAQGRASVSFTAPDSITRYRLVAVAHAGHNQFGAGKTAFEISKPLLLSPALPQFAHENDEIVARAVVQNQTGEAGEVLVSLELDELTQSKGATDKKLSQHVQIAAHGSAFCEFPVRFASVGQATWTWRTRFAKSEPGSAFTDAVLSTIAVGSARPLLREVLGERPEPGVNLLRKADPWLLEGKGTISIKLSNTRLLEVAESIHKLLHYPYGCAEQTSSSLLPWIVASNLASVGSESGALRTNLTQAQAVAKGVARLLSMQTSSGGISYWPGESEPMPWASAYGAFVLTLAKQGGFAVPESELQQLYTYLGKTLRETEDAEVACLSLYSLAHAKRAEPAYHEQWFNQRGRLSAENRALLALAVHTSGGSPSMVAELLAQAPDQQEESSSFGSPARTKAILLLAQMECLPDLESVDRLLTELLHVRAEGDWGTTQGNAWALLALSRYAEKFETGDGQISGHVHYAGASVPFELSGTNRVFTCTYAFSNSAPAATLSLPARQKDLFSTVTIESRPANPPKEKVGQGFVLKRSYQKLGDQQELLGLQDLRVGDRVLAILEINVLEQTQYVAVNDPLPAVLEIVNPEFRTQQIRAADQALLEKRELGYWPGSFQEARKDRMLFFANWVEPGTYQLRYLARVRAAGTATAPAAKIEAMYRPNRFALSEPTVVQASPAED